MHIEIGTCIRKLLGEGRSLPQNRSFPVDDIDRNNEDEGYTEQNGRRICKMVFAADIYKD